MATDLGNPYRLPELDRGVYRDTASFDGTVEYRIIDARGKCQAKLIISAEWDEEGIQASCHRLLRNKDRRHLKAI